MDVLCIEDNGLYQQMLRYMLEESGQTQMKVTYRERLREGLICLTYARYDALLLDLSLPDSEGLETLRSVLRCMPHLPVVVLTNKKSEHLAEQAVREGAQDYLVKEEVDGKHLARSVQFAIARKQKQVHWQSSSKYSSPEQAYRYVWCVDNYSRLVIANIRLVQLWQELYGILLYPGAQFTEVLPPKDRFRWARMYRMALKGHLYRSTCCYTYNGQLCKLLVSAGPLWTNGMVTGVFFLVMDDSSGQPEEANLQATRAQLSTFMEWLCHDIRGPLSTILGLVNVAQLENSSEVFKSECLTHIQSCTEKLVKKTTDLVHSAINYREIGLSFIEL